MGLVFRNLFSRMAISAFGTFMIRRVRLSNRFAASGPVAGGSFGFFMASAFRDAVAYGLTGTRSAPVRLL